MFHLLEGIGSPTDKVTMIFSANCPADIEKSGLSMFEVKLIDGRASDGRENGSFVATVYLGLDVPQSSAIVGTLLTMI